MTIALGGTYLSRSVRTELSYTKFSGAGRYNVITDRDHVNFSIQFAF